MALIHCMVQTPQFEGSQEKFHLKKQIGVFDTETLLFKPYDHLFNDKGKVGKHSVQFHSITNFEKSRIK